MKNIAFMALIVSGILVGIFFLLPKNNCDDPIDPQLKTLSNRAEQGDIIAISALYNYYKDKKIEAFEDYWALNGALQGDIGLTRKYVDIFKNRFNAEEKQRIIEVIKEQERMPGAACLMFYLNDEKNHQTLCPH